MSYVTKYHFVSTDRFGLPTTVNLKLNGYSGTDTLLGLGGISFEFGQGRASTVIRGSAVKIRLWSLTQGQFAEFRNITDRKWQVEVLKASSPYWYGWLTPEVFSEPFKASLPYRIEITAVDGLGDLANIDYDIAYDLGTGSSRLSLLSIIIQCLVKTNLNLPVCFSSSLRPSGTSGDPFTLAFYDNANFMDSNGTALKCSDVLEKFFPFGITIKQWRGKWYVVRTADLRGPILAYIYNSLGVYSSNPYIDMNEPINDTSSLTYLNVPVNQNGIMSQEQAYKQALINVDYGLKKSMLKNGNFYTVGIIWNDAAFTPGLSGLEYRTYGNTTCGYIWPADLAGVTRGITQTIIVEASSSAFVISLSVAVCAESTLGSGIVYDNARFRIKLTGASVTYYLDKLLGWITTPTYVDITHLQSFYRWDDPMWWPVKITVSSIPVSGTLEVYLCATPYSGSTSVLSFGVCYTEVLAYQIGNAYLSANKIKGVNNAEYNFIPSEPTLTINDAPAVSNSRLMFKNFLSDGSGVPTTLWTVDGISGSYTLAELYLRYALSLHRRPTKIISLTLRGNVEWPGAITDREGNFYEVVSAAMNNRESEWTLELREILPYVDLSPAISVVSGSSSPSSEAGAGAVSSQTIVPTIPVVKIDFSSTRAPSILNYDADFANTHGQYPTIRLFTINGSGNWIERSEKPIFNIASGAVGSIVYDLAIPETGFIILY